jgi:hypothetical protein
LTWIRNYSQEEQDKNNRDQDYDFFHSFSFFLRSFIFFILQKSCHLNQGNVKHQEKMQ